MSRKRVLVVSELFHPLNAIGAVRPTKLAVFLAQEGYCVDVYTAETIGLPNLHMGAPYNIVSAYTQMPEEKTLKPTNGAKVKKRGKLLTELAMTRRQLLQYKVSRRFADGFANAVKKGTVALAEYDCIFTTFGPVGTILVGLYAKKTAPQIRWICDFRDPMVSQIMPKLVTPFYGYLQRKSIRLAQCVTTVSEGYQKRIMPKKYMEKCSVIPNGYDDKDRSYITDTAPEEKKFSFAYVGSLYEGRRDMGNLFRAIRWAIEEGLIGMEQLAFHYAGSEARFLLEQAKRYDLESIIENHGQLSRTDCLQLQASVRFLTMSTWNDKGEEGVFPGKLIEYMLIGKPVINIVGGQLANSEVAQVIRRLQLGVSCEEADKESYEELKQWFAAQCKAYNAGQPAVFAPNTELMEARYKWKNIVKRFGVLIDG